MKRICSFVIAFCMLFSFAYAVDTMHSNERYPFISCGPFWFIPPNGFVLERSSTGDPIYTNANGEMFMFHFTGGDTSHLISENHNQTLQNLEEIAERGIGKELWAGALYAEKSGGCYKVGSLIKDDLRSFSIAALCPEGFLFVVSTPTNTSSGMDLAHGIFKTLSYQEYVRKFQE